MNCPKCNKPMKVVMHFEDGRQYQYHKCTYCQERTKSKRIHFDDVIKEDSSNINNTNQNNIK